LLKRKKKRKEGMEEGREGWRKRMEGGREINN
jgi:hypothetical protein